MIDSNQYAYAVIDQTSGTTFDTNSAITAQRFLGVVAREYSGENQTIAFHAFLRQPGGEHKLQAKLEIENGTVVSAHAEPEFIHQVEKEKQQLKDTGADQIY
ncbi:hypothetical protein GCM10027299_42110 [Larkinella ripae]